MVNSNGRSKGQLDSGRESLSAVPPRLSETVRTRS
jgi:hypothetical protein